MLTSPEKRHSRPAISPFITTPAAAAQHVCDRLVGAGGTSILNFAPVVLSVPAGVDVRKVDLSIELQILAFHAQRRAIVGVAHLGESEWQDRQARRRTGDGEATGPAAARPLGPQELADGTGVTAQAVGT